MNSAAQKMQELEAECERFLSLYDRDCPVSAAERGLEVVLKKVGDVISIVHKDHLLHGKVVLHEIYWKETGHHTIIRFLADPSGNLGWITEKCGRPTSNPQKADMARLQQEGVSWVDLVESIQRIAFMGLATQQATQPMAVA